MSNQPSRVPAAQKPGAHAHESQGGGLGQYIQQVSPISQQAYLKASNTGAEEVFGFSVAISGDTAVVGAPNEDSNATGVNGNQSDNSALNSGAAYVFVRSGTNWSQQAIVFGRTNSDKCGGSTLGDFGTSVAVSGDTVVIGTPGDDSSATGINGNQIDDSATNSGAAYVFVRNGTNCSQQAYLKASNTGVSPSIFGECGDSFGLSVAVSGHTLVVGAIGESSNPTGVNGDQGNNLARDSGAAYVFTGLGIGPTLTLLPDGNGGYFLRFAGHAGFTYRLERATNLTGSWPTIDTQTAPASGIVELHDPSPPAGQAFYRTASP